MSKRVHSFIAAIYSIVLFTRRNSVGGFSKLIIAALLWVALNQIAVAHDATLLINRTNAQDLELRFSLDLITTLQRALAPRVNPLVFVARYATLSAAEFNDEITKAKSIVENEIRIEGPRGNVFVVQSWQWPASDEIQTSFKQAAEAILVDPSAISNIPVFVLTLSAHSKSEISRIHLSIGPRLRPILLVRPNIEQFWIDDLSPDTMLDF